MNIPTVNMLEFSADDPIWICQAPFQSFQSVDSDIDLWVEGSPGTGWDVAGAKTIAKFSLNGSGQGALEGPFCLVQGINHTGAVNAIIGKPEDSDSVRGERSRFAKAKKEVRRNARARLRLLAVDEKQFFEHIKKRRIDVTYLRSEGLVFIHFPIWEKTDVPMGTSAADKFAHKMSYIDFASGMTVAQPSFQSKLLKAIHDDIAKMPPSEQAARFSIRTYEFKDSKFVKVPSTLTLGDLTGCSCRGTHPNVIQMARQDDDCEACEMMICEIIGPGPVISCHLVSWKPYACHP